MCNVTLSICGSKTTCNLMQLLYGALPEPYVPVEVTRGAMSAHLYTHAPLGCRTSQYRTTFIHLPVLCGTILVTPYSMVWHWQVSRAEPIFFIGLAARSLFVSYCLPFLFFHFMGWYCGAGVFGLMVCWVTLSQPCIASLF